MQSSTDMYNCAHGPKKDCHACLVPELVAALANIVKASVETYPWVENFNRTDCRMCNRVWGNTTPEHHKEHCPIPTIRALIEKAKLLYVGPAEVPLDHGHPHE